MTDNTCSGCGAPTHARLKCDYCGNIRQRTESEVQAYRAQVEALRPIRTDMLANSPQSQTFGLGAHPLSSFANGYHDGLRKAQLSMMAAL